MQHAFTTDTVSTALSYLQNTNANMVVNSHRFFVGADELISVRGMIGIRSSGSKILEGAFCWGERDNLKSLVFSAEEIGGNIEFFLPERPANWEMGKADIYAKAFISSVIDKLFKRMVTRAENKKTGGSYTGPRLEARKREATLPSNRFGEATHLFTQPFVHLAPNLHVTYK